MSESKNYEHSVVITANQGTKYLHKMPEEIQKQLREYIEMVKDKYNQDRTLKNKK